MEANLSYAPQRWITLTEPQTAAECLNHTVWVCAKFRFPHRNLSLGKLKPPVCFKHRAAAESSRHVQYGALLGLDQLQFWHLYASTVTGLSPRRGHHQICANFTVDHFICLIPCSWSKPILKILKRGLNPQSWKHRDMCTAWCITLRNTHCCCYLQHTKAAGCVILGVQCHNTGHWSLSACPGLRSCHHLWALQVAAGLGLFFCSILTQAGMRCSCVPREKSLHDQWLFISYLCCTSLLSLRWWQQKTVLFPEDWNVAWF